MARQTHNLLVAPCQVYFRDAFRSPSLALMATFPSPSAHQMVLSVFVNTDLIWALSSHREMPAVGWAWGKTSPRPDKVLIAVPGVQSKQWERLEKPRQWET